MLAKEKKSLVMKSSQISHAIARIAHEILEAVNETDQLAVIGIRSNGDHLADRLVKKIKEFDDRAVEIGYMDITLYRDDLMTKSEHPEIKTTDILFSVNDKLVILVDDVLFTGRTIRAALNQIPDYGRAKAIRLAVLVDRGGKELPIRADYVGKNIPAAASEDVVVSLTEVGGDDTVIITARPNVNKEEKGGEK